LEKTSCRLARAMAEGFLSQIVDFFAKKPERIQKFSAKERGDSPCDNIF
jgi:hypothetical protein